MIDVATLIISSLSLVASIIVPIAVSVYNNKHQDKRQKKAFEFKKETTANQDAKHQSEAQLEVLKNYLLSTKSVIDDFCAEQKISCFRTAKNDIFIHAPTSLIQTINDLNNAVEDLLNCHSDTNPLYLKELANNQYQLTEAAFFDYFQSVSKS